MTFDKRQSNIAKGVAVLLLLWHHVFTDSARVRGSITSFLFVGDTPLACLISPICKVCVALFCVISGYGMFKSFDSYANKNRINGKLKLKKASGICEKSFTQYNEPILVCLYCVRALGSCHRSIPIWCI